MDKTIIEVPRGIRYISDWEDFYNSIFPRIPHILDKQIPGCGFTEWCLTNPDDVILCSPRNMLILNKWEQHKGGVFRVYNSKFNIDPGVDKELNDERVPRPGSVKPVLEFSERLLAMGQSEITSFGNDLRRELTEYIGKRRNEGQPLKILVTYDSFRILKDVLINYFQCFDKFQVVVDEMQAIFVDAKFKSSTELEFVQELQDVKHLCYVSATPMIESYLEMIPEFSGLPYYELDWGVLDPGRVVRPSLDVRVVTSIYAPIKKIVGEYLSGKYERKVVRREDGTLASVDSKELVIYVNSVNNITGIVQKNGLKPEQVNILCSNTPENQSKIEKKLGKGWIIGKVPLPGEPRKMFTLCTRTVYLGADFYSDNARTVILSDANIDCLAVDISLDLPQIMGRQRLLENPWKNCAQFFYRPIKRTSDGVIVGKQDFDDRIREKLEKTESLLRSWENTNSGKDKHNLAEVFKKIAKLENYKDNYVAVNLHAGKQLLPVVNNLVMIAEKRAFDIQQTDYADRFSVFSAISNTMGIHSSVVDEVKTFLLSYQNIEGIRNKLIFVNEYKMSDEARRLVFNQLEENMKQYLLLGHDRLISLSYNVTRIKSEINVKVFSENMLATRIYQEFKENSVMTKADIKKCLQQIYKEVGYGKTAKAIDIGDWFETKEVQIKRSSGYRLIKRKK